MSATTYLHIGTAKSGTTFLQQVLSRNRDSLRESGLLYPDGRPVAHFWASMDLREKGFKGHRYPQAQGMWGQLANEADTFSASTLISHETLALASPDTVKRAVASFSGDVKVILTCRELGGLLPAAWQERIKNRHTDTFDDFLTAVFANWNGGDTPPRSRFWPLQNLVKLTRLWSEAVGDSNVTLVTVPPERSGSHELWERYATAVGMSEVEVDLTVPNTNPSLGVAETEILRRLNEILPGDLTWPEYERRVKGRFVRRDLSPQRHLGALGLPQRWHALAQQVANDTIDAMAEHDYRIVGDLEDLRPRPQPEPTMPEDIAAEALLGSALTVLATTASRPEARKATKR